MVLLDDGKPWDGTVPAWALQFRPNDWPGDQPWERWDKWWESVCEWADRYMPLGFSDLVPLMSEPPSRPWNPADI